MALLVMLPMAVVFAIMILELAHVPEDIGLLVALVVALVQAKAMRHLVLVIVIMTAVAVATTTTPAQVITTPELAAVLMVLHVKELRVVAG